MKKAVFVIIATLVLAPLRAQEPPQKTSFSLEEAIAYALVYNYQAIKNGKLSPQVCRRSMVP